MRSLLARPPGCCLGMHSLPFRPSCAEPAREREEVIDVHHASCFPVHMHALPRGQAGVLEVTIFTVDRRLQLQAGQTARRPEIR
jgi:hypothetical protein